MSAEREYRSNAKPMIRAYGTPAPQGSKQAYVRGKRAVLVEVSKRVKPWREAVVEAAQKSGLSYGGSVSVRVTFHVKRPQSHYGRRKGQQYLKDTAPHYVSNKPDIDKLCRSTFDALTDSGVIVDDSKIVVMHVQKTYCDDGEPPGATIFIEDVTDPTLARASSIHTRSSLPSSEREPRCS